MEKVTVLTNGVSDKPNVELEFCGFKIKALGDVLQLCDFGEVIGGLPGFDFAPFAWILTEYAGRIYQANHEVDCITELDKIAHELYALAEILAHTDFSRIADRPQDESPNGKVYIENFSFKPIAEKISEYGQRILSQSWGQPSAKGMTREELKGAFTWKPKKAAKGGAA